jgi:uncharacterized protein (TIGR03083 family)
VQHDEFCDAIRREGHVLATAAGAAGVDAPVPSCPEWSVGDLLAHIGRIHRWITAIAHRGPDAPESHWSQAEPPPPAERVEWFATGVDPLADALSSAGPNVEVWSWTDDHSTGFWGRRMANETAIHRWDAQLAAGATDPIERDLAADGVDEYLMLLQHWRGADALRDLAGTIHFHCTDGDGEWLLRLADGAHVTREHAKGDVAARGSASDLYLLVSGRVPIDTVEVFGDDALLRAFLERARW